MILQSVARVAANVQQFRLVKRIRIKILVTTAPNLLMYRVCVVYPTTFYCSHVSSRVCEHFR